MPIYEYYCKSCKESFEKLTKLGVDVKPCPKCKTESKKIMSSTNFELKGSGWASSGYSKNN